MAMSCPLSCYCGLICSCVLRDIRNEASPVRPTTCPPIEGPDDTRANRTVYILLLGAAETGKSTIMRQMKIIHNGGMSPASLRSYTCHVFANVMVCAARIVEAARKAGVVWALPEAAHAAEVIGGLTAAQWGLGGGEVPHIPPDHAHLLQVLWSDPAAREVCSRANEFNLPDSTAFFLSAINRLSQLLYRPTQEDVLRLRLPTRSAVVYDFTDRNWTFRITDVGGQRGERRRWLRLFDGVNAVIFLASLSEFDQEWSDLEEGDEGKPGKGINRLELSLRLFRQTLQYPGFASTTVILFLNKVDVLQQKIATSNLAHYFPDYLGPAREAPPAVDFVRGLFVSRAEGLKRRSEIYPHETCATDTNKIKFVFAAVRDHILYVNATNFTHF